MGAKKKSIPHFETIFDHNITKEELNEIFSPSFGDDYVNESNYLYISNNDRYEFFADLSMLMEVRGDYENQRMYAEKAIQILHSRVDVWE